VVGILDVGSRAQQGARQAREAISQNAPDAPPTSRVLISCKDSSGGKREKFAPTQQETAKKPPSRNAKKEAERMAERLERWQMLDAVRRLLGADHRTSACHRLMIPTPAAERQSGEMFRGVDIHHTTREDGTTRARYGNLITCGSVWACPICSERVAAQRASDMESALQRHRAAGGRLMFLTLTHHHERGTKLSDQLKQQSEALKLMQRDWTYRELCRKNGVLGMVRGLEMTHSDRNGWHAHVHFLVFIAGTEEQAEQHAEILRGIDAQCAERIRAQGKTPRVKHDRQAVEIPKATRLPKAGRDLIVCWQKAAKKAGLYTVRDAQKAIIASDDDRSLEELARYLTKCEMKRGEDGKPRWVSTGEDNVEAFGGSAAHRDAVKMVENAGQAATSTSSAALEITMSQTKRGSRTPMGMLREYALERIEGADTPERKRQDRHARRMGALFTEYAFATRGKNALVWGAGLKLLFAVDEVDDQDAANVEDDNTAVDRLLLTLTPDDWSHILRAPRGTRGELLEIARGGNPDVVRHHVQRLRDDPKAATWRERERQTLRREQVAMLHRFKRNHTGGSQ